MATLATLRVKLIADVEDFQKGLESAADRGRRLSEGFVNVGKTLTAGLTLPLAVAGAGMLKLAIDAEETAAKFETVMGPATARVTAEIARMRDTIPSTTAELQNAVADMTALGTAAGLTSEAAADLSLQFVTAAADLGSFNNVPTDDALAAIRSALVGSSEPMLQFGVDTRQAALEAIALEAGLIGAGEEMTATARAQAILLAIQNDASFAMGDAARTADSTANSMKFLRAEAAELGTKLGTILLPAFKPLIDLAGSLLDRFSNMSPEMQRVVVIVGVVAAAMGPLLIIMGSLLGAAASVAAAFGTGGLLAALTPLLGPIALVVAGVAALGAGLVLLWKNSETFRDIVIGAWNAVKAAAETVFNAIQKVIESVIDTVKAAWDRWGDDLLAGAKAAWDGIKKAVEVGIAFVKGIIDTYVAVAKKLWEAFGDDLVGAAKDTWNEIKLTIDTFLGRIREFWDKWGGDIMAAATAVWNAIKLAAETAWNLVLAVVETVLNGIKAFWNIWGDEITAIASAVWAQVKLVVTTAINVVKDTIGLVLAAIRGDWSEVWSRIQALTNTAWEAIKGTAQNLWAGLVAIFSGLKDSAVGIVTAMWEAIKGQFLGKIEDIKEEVAKFKANVVGTFQSIADIVTFGSIWPDMWASIGAQTAEGVAESTEQVAAMSGNVIEEFGYLNEQSDRIWGEIKDGIGEDVATMADGVADGAARMANEILQGATSIASVLDQLFGTKISGWLGQWGGWLNSLLSSFANWASELGGIIGTVGNWLDDLFGGGGGGFELPSSGNGFGLTDIEGASMIAKSVVDWITSSTPAWAPNSGVSLGLPSIGTLGANAAGAALPFATVGALSYGGEWLNDKVGYSGYNGALNQARDLERFQQAQAQRAEDEAAGFNFSVPYAQTDPGGYAAWAAEQQRQADLVVGYNSKGSGYAPSATSGYSYGGGTPTVIIQNQPPPVYLQVDGREMASTVGPYVVDRIRLEEAI